MAENLQVCVLLPSLLTILRSTDSFAWGVVLDGTVQLTNEKWKCSKGKKFAFYGHSGFLSKPKQGLLPAATRSKLLISHLKTKAAILARHYIGMVDRFSCYSLEASLERLNNLFPQRKVTFLIAHFSNSLHAFSPPSSMSGA
jgi:hypothetical protein